MKKILSWLIISAMLCSYSIVWADDAPVENISAEIQEETGLEMSDENETTEKIEDSVSVSEITGEIDVEEKTDTIQNNDETDVTDKTSDSEESVEFEESDQVNMDEDESVDDSVRFVDALPTNKEQSGFGDVDVTRYKTLTEDDIARIEREAQQRIIPISRGASLYNLEDEDPYPWYSCGVMTSPRSYMSSVVVNNNIYTFGGVEDDTVTFKAEVYNTTTSTWQSLTNMPSRRYKHIAVAHGNYIYICGGYNQYEIAVDTISVYDIANNTWLDNIDTPNNNTNYSAGVYGNYLYIFSGKENGVETSKVYRYSFLHDVWTPLDSMPCSSIDERAITINRGFYVISDRYIYEYDVLQRLWTLIDRIPINLYDYAAINRGDENSNEIYITGGRTNSSSASASSYAIYRNDMDSQPSAANWKPEWYRDLELETGVACHNMVIANGYVYILGGSNRRNMYRRSLNATKDDIREPGSTMVGSINSPVDTDSFIYVITEAGYYEIQHYNPIYSNNLQYKYHISISGTPVNGLYTNEMGAVYLESYFDTYSVYMIDVFDAGGVHHGNYAYELVKVEDDAADTLDGAVEIPIETNVYRSFIGRYDTDCMKFTVPVMGNYDISVIGDEAIANESETRSLVKIYDSNKNEIYSFNNNSNNTQSCQLNSGTYYISFTPIETTYDTNTSGYTIKIHNDGTMNYMNTDRAKHEMVAVNGKLYALSGVNDNFNLINTFESYNPETKLWTSEGEMELFIRKGFTTAVKDEIVYIIGGYRDGTYYPTVNIYNPQSNAWGLTMGLNTERERAGAVSNGDKIYIVGGRNANGYLSDIEVLDTTVNVVTQTIALPHSMMDVQPFFHNNTLYLVGGVDSDGYCDEVYAYVDGQWVLKASMPFAASYMRGKYIDNKFYCAAVDSNGNTDILRYDPVQNTWTVMREDFAEDLLYYGFEIFNNHLYITGGYSTAEDEVVSTVRTFDYITDIESMDIAIPIRTIGMEYEQTNNSDATNAPKILGVNARVLDQLRGVYELSINEDQYECDARSVPFFFWSAQDGMFAGASEDYRVVTFYADPNTAGRKVKVVVGIGDGRGYVDKKAILLDGNNETE